jgi:hypothetical protein
MLLGAHGRREFMRRLFEIPVDLRSHVECPAIKPQPAIHSRPARFALGNEAGSLAR